MNISHKFILRPLSRGSLHLRYMLTITVNCKSLQIIFNILVSFNTLEIFNTLVRVFPYMRFEKGRTTMKTFPTFQLRWCPLIWMFHNRNLNSKTKSLNQLRALRTTYDDRTVSFIKLLTEDNCASFHYKFCNL